MNALKPYQALYCAHARPSPALQAQSVQAGQAYPRCLLSGGLPSGLVAAVLCAAGFLGLPLHALAFGTTVGNYDLTINSTVSLGSAWRVEGRDRRLYGANNRDEGGRLGLSPSPTSDDGNLNFDTGDRFSTVLKGVHEFELKRANYGAFTRIKWFYDEALNNDAVLHGHAPNGFVPNSKLQDARFHPYSRFDGIDVLDAYGYWNTRIGGKTLDVRLGRQVVGWGESTLIFSPITGINTLDLSALRRPGVGLKEAFTPSEQLYFNLGLNESTSLEAFYQLRWRKTVTEGCGTYFAATDIAADGCNVVSLASAGSDQTGFNASQALGVGAFRRTSDFQPGDGGQYGLALRKYVASIGTELGLYYLNYHSRNPIISGVKQTTASPFSARYALEYPEDIGVLGASFATSLGAWAWSGELSYAMDAPIQINAADILLSVLSPAYGSSYFSQRYQAAAAGTKVAGFDKFDVTQLQSSLIRSFDRALGSSRIVFLGEVGATWVSNLPEASTALSAPRYGRSPAFGSATPLPVAGGAALPAADGINATGFVTNFAWGYRMRFVGEYRDALGSIDLIPSLAWSHDVEGWSPEPGQAFNEGRQSVALGLGLELDANTKASIQYIKFTNAAQFDVFRDRDYITLNASYSF